MSSDFNLLVEKYKNEKPEPEMLVFYSLADFVNTTNEMYGECVAKSIRNSLGTYDYTKGFYNFRYWTHNGTKFREPTRIEFNKTEADEDFEPVMKLIEDEKNGISHMDDEPINFSEEFEKMIAEENATCGISFDDVEPEEIEDDSKNSKILINQQNDCNCKK